MNKEEILKFLNDNPAFALATSDGNIPHVRTLQLHKADDTGIYFMVGKFKDVYRQLSVNPYVELCFHKGNTQVRINGQVENIDKDLELKKEVLSVRPFMTTWIEQVGFKYMGVFRLRYGKAVIWTLETELEPKVIVNL
ncbi:MAG: pyridoxamine 5'-phosphate oxidase family protein [Bacteroidetes bacterium]|nr:pyridoxamine 5'-phosphate oxidase family protein [Bacteroidota bacterium]